MILTQNYRLGKFSPNTEICYDFNEIWHSQQIEHGNYKYNTRQCLNVLSWLFAQNDYRLENSTHSQNMINCFNNTLKVVKVWD